MGRSFSLLFLFVWLWPNFLTARVNPLHKKSNIVVVVFDEEGSTPFGWKEVIKPWAEENLPGRQMLKERGVVFKRHYVGATACVPSRGVFYTGQYPGVTGLTQTNGFAKPWDDPSMTWLHENTVPTIGNWLLAAGVSPENIGYFGKFHLAEVDLRDENGEVKETITINKTPIEEHINEYKRTPVLERFGFPSAWKGPEPHGPKLERSGEYTDPGFVDEMKEFITAMAQKQANGDEEPFIAFLNLVNPHDIVLAWALKLAGKMNIDPNAPIPPVCKETDELDPDKEPKVHKDYHYTYKKMYCWEPLMRWFYDGEKNRAKIRQFYYTLLKKSDEHLVAIINHLKEKGIYDDTIIIVTSDHGDYLGRRKNLEQKWHGLHNEPTKIPLIISGPDIEHRVVKQFTSHVDIVPTLLSLWNIDEKSTSEVLKESFSKVVPLPGMDLSPLIYGETEDDMNRELYMSTEDEISRGSNNYSATWVTILPKVLLPWVPFGKFEPIKGSRHVEAIRLYDGEAINGKRNEWSFMRYYDPDGIEPDDYRLYRLNTDRFEVKDLSHLFKVRIERYKKKMSFWREYYQHRNGFSSKKKKVSSPSFLDDKN